jgi:heme-degrading monooxygenase HmoA
MTYVTRQEVELQGLRFGEFEARQGRLNEVFQTIAGFEARRVLRSLGYPARYTVLGYWQSFAAADAAARGATLRGWFEQHPQPAWVAAVRPTEAYEQVHEVAGRTTAGTVPGFVRLNDWTFTNAGAFASSRRELSEFFAQNAEGFFHHRLLRFLGGGGRYLVLYAWTSLEASDAAHRMPEVQAILAKTPMSMYANAPSTTAEYAPVPVTVPAS